MIEPKRGEKIIKVFEIKKSHHGKGLFYITNLGVYFETYKNGLVLNLSFEALKAYNNTKAAFRIEWEQNDQRYHYEFCVSGSAKEVFIAYSDANREFSESSSEVDALKKKHSDQSNPEKL
jgi:hypothetical protein